MVYLAALIITFSLLSAGNPEDTGTLFVKLENVSQFRGSIRLGIYERKDLFPDGGEIASRVIQPKIEEDLRFSFPDFPYGRYAIAVYHDINNNGKLDTNVLGIPTEPYAFSNNPGDKWKTPGFDEVAFDFNNQTMELRLFLKRWSEK